MRNFLLTTTAVAALFAANGVVSAQTQGQGSGAPATQAAPSGGMQGGTGTGSSSGRDQAQSPRQGQNTGQSTQGRDQGTTTQRQGQSDPGQHGQTQRQGQSSQGTSDKAGQAAGRNGQGGKAGETTGSAPSGTASISTEQRSKIKQHKSAFSAGRVNHVDFKISVGTTVPHSVTLHALPATVIEVVPAWRSYRYVMVEEEIVIIDPATYKIIAVIEV